MDDAALIRRFVDSFHRFDNMTIVPPDQSFDVLLTEDSFDEYGFGHLRPAAIATPEECLGGIRSRFDDALPQLYELLVLSYRWLEVDLGVCRLLANEPASDLGPLMKQIFGDPILTANLVPARLVQFAKATDSYDPVCFDLNRFRHGDCPIVCVNHESILCYDQIGTPRELFGSFRELLVAVVEM